MATIDYEAVRELYDQGEGRNAIAKRLGVSNRTVDNACKVLGINWGDKVPATAVQVRSRRAANERAEMAQKWRTLALTELDKALDPNTPPAEARGHAIAAGIATQRELDIATHVSEHKAHSERTPEQMKSDQEWAELDEALNSPNW